MSSPISRGFRHLRRPSDGEEGRVPPGQYVTQDFPVLSAGPTPHTPLPEWTFSIRQGGDTLKSWTWQEFQALPAETVTVDVHCVTRWSKLDTVWRGVSVDMLLDQVEHHAPYVLAFCDGGYTTTCRSRTSPVARHGWHSTTRASRLDPNTAAQPGCSCRTCTSGRARNGYGAWNCSNTTNRVSGRPTAITYTGTHGGNSGAPATDLTGRHCHFRKRGKGRGPHDRVGRTRLAGASGRAHSDVRLTAEAGYTAERSYSIASADGEPAAITVEWLAGRQRVPWPAAAGVRKGNDRRPSHLRSMRRSRPGRRDGRLPARAEDCGPLPQLLRHAHGHLADPGPELCRPPRPGRA